MAKNNTSLSNRNLLRRWMIRRPKPFQKQIKSSGDFSNRVKKTWTSRLTTVSPAPRKSVSQGRYSTSKTLPTRKWNRSIRTIRRRAILLIWASKCLHRRKSSTVKTYTRSWRWWQLSEAVRACRNNQIRRAIAKSQLKNRMMVRKQCRINTNNSHFSTTKTRKSNLSAPLTSPTNNLNSRSSRRSSQNPTTMKSL